MTRTNVVLDFEEARSKLYRNTLIRSSIENVSNVVCRTFSARMNSAPHAVHVYRYIVGKQTTWRAEAPAIAEEALMIPQKQMLGKLLSPPKWTWTREHKQQATRQHSITLWIINRNCEWRMLIITITRSLLLLLAWPSIASNLSSWGKAIAGPETKCCTEKGEV